MGKLTDILRDADAERLRSAWDKTEAAGELSALPAGEYVAHVIAGELINGKTKGTPGYKLTFRVAEGEHVGRRIWHDCWLTEAAMPQTKRDLFKLGVKSLDQLDRPLPKGIRCQVKLALRRDDDGEERNRVRSFEVIGIDAQEPEPFAPKDADPQADDQSPSTEK
jgi:hypothetical protein